MNGFHQSGILRKKDIGESVNLLSEHLNQVRIDFSNNDEVVLPIVGEVWVRAHKHTRGEKLGIDKIDHETLNRLDIITVQRVSKDSVIGWDGNAPDLPKVRHCDLEEFNPKAPHAWKHDLALSSIVDKVF